jgi:hypothetical protein
MTPNIRSLIKDMEKQLTDYIESAAWHRGKANDLELKIIGLKEILSDLRELP